MHNHRQILIHHIQFLIIHLFRIPSQTIPTHYSRTLDMELQLILLSCDIGTNSFISHVELIPNSSFQFHDSSHTIIILTSCYNSQITTHTPSHLVQMPSSHNTHHSPFMNHITHTYQSTIYISHHNNHTQTNINHPRAIKQLNSALSRPAPRLS